jgi:hypothetical protein
MGNKGKKKQTIRSDLQVDLGRYDGWTNHAQCDMSG